MKVGWIFLGLLAAFWLYSIVVEIPPYGLDETPRHPASLTIQNDGI